MASSFIFSVVIPEVDANVDKRHLVVFSAHEEWNPKSISRAIQRHVVSRRLPEAGLILIGLEPHIKNIKKFAEAYSSEDPLGIQHFGGGRPCRIMVFDAGGDLQELEAKGDSERLLRVPTRVSNTIRKKGARIIFDARGGRVQARGKHHFQKPSGRHSEEFIRAGNVLVKGAEVSFLAAWLLRHFRPDTRWIYLDTGSIGWIASELLRLKHIVSNIETHCAIDSYSSYRGLQDGSFETHDSLFIISASGSGGLGNQLSQMHNIPENQIVTLFYDGDPGRQSSHVICCPSESLGNDDEAKSVLRRKSFSADECELCRMGSQFTRITGDNFMLEAIPSHPILLAKRHAPTWLSGFQERTFGRGIIRCFRRHSEHDTPSEISIFIPQLIEAARKEEKLRKRMTRFLSHAVPASLKWIVPVGGTGARVIADVVADFYESIDPSSGNRFKIMEHEEFLTKVVKPRAIEGGGSLVVTAGAVATGSTLLKFSQQIRAIREDVPVTFIIGLSRSKDPDRRREVKTSLTTQREGPPAAFHELEQIYLADSPESLGSSWHEELRLLESSKDLFDDDELFLQRIEELKKCREDSGAPGLENNVFWAAPTGARITLRDGFIFLAPGVNEDSVSQADLHFTVNAVLRNLRDGGAGADSILFRDSFSHPLLTPANFERFDDGVIQAALLRAARPRELDYSDEEPFSRQMREIIKGLIGSADEPHGEGLFEFFLALACGRLRLIPGDTEDVLNGVKAQLQSTKPVYRKSAFQIWYKILTRSLEGKGGV